MSKSLIHRIAGLELTGRTAIRYAIVLVFLWIGLLKFFPYEADGIVPFVANSPFMSEFYHHPDQYKKHINPEGAYIAENHQWHEQNNTYGFSFGLGIFIISVGLLVAIHRIAPLASMIGSILVFVMTLGTLSFLVSTPEAWVPHLGDRQWGFPYLSGRGRLVIKDIVILAGSILTMSESAQLYLARRISRSPQRAAPAATAFLMLLLATAAKAQQNPDIPVIKSLTIDKSLSKSAADQLIRTGQLFYAFWNTGKEEYLQKAVSPDFHDNTLPAGRPQGYKGIPFASANFRRAVPDLRCSIEDLIISKDKIVCRQIYTGHNTGSVMGHPASGKPIQFFAIDILHVRNGKIYEDWHLEDNLTFLQQTGVVKL